jgi:hypothetical protein
MKVQVFFLDKLVYLPFLNFFLVSLPKMVQCQLCLKILERTAAQKHLGRVHHSHLLKGSDEKLESLFTTFPPEKETKQDPILDTIPEEESIEKVEDLSESFDEEGFLLFCFQVCNFLETFILTTGMILMILLFRPISILMMKI